MKKLKTPNRILQKIMIAILAIFVLFNFIAPIKVQAGLGGVLLTPIRSFVRFVGDCIMQIVQDVFVGGDIKTGWLVEVDEESGEIENIETGDYYNFKISPESIFSNKITAFDINFFNPQTEETYEDYHWEDKNREIIYISSKHTYGNQEGTYTEGTYSEGAYRIEYGDKSYSDILEQYGWTYTETEGLGETEKWSHPNKVSANNTASSSGTTWSFTWTEINSDTNQIITYELEHSMGANQSGSNDIAKLYKSEKVKVVDSTTTRESSAGILQSTVSYWYNLLRNISIIGLLSVLVYIGIRILISSTATDKSKYKEMLKDWLVAMCLLFFMHYFMSFVITLTDTITNSLTDISSDVVNSEHVAEGSDQLIGEIRWRASDTGNNSTAYTIIYLVLVFYTIMFAFMYLKRVLYMAFFTMIAPLVALTYPLDKIRDGKAQAFDMWMKEYTFNALMQPFHLIIYYVLVGSAMSLAISNPIYALVAIGFVMQAEKLLRKFFGFDRASTAGALSGALGGALAMKGIDAITKRAKGAAGRKGSDKGGNSRVEENSDRQIRTADSSNTDFISDALGGDVEETEASENRRLLSDGGDDYEQYQEDIDAHNRGLDMTNDLSPEEMAEEDPNYMYMHPELFSGEDNTIQQNSEDLGENDENLESDNEETTQTQNDAEEARKFYAAKTLAKRYIAKGGKGIAKLVVKGMGAATMGTIGLAAGLASDDYSNVIKYGAAGAAGGVVVGGRVAQLPSNAYRKIKRTANNIRNEYEQMAYTPAQRKQIINNRLDNEFLKDKQVQERYSNEFGEQNYEAAMQAALEYRKQGITDNETIIKAMQLKTKGLAGTGYADKKKIAAAKLSTQISGEKDIETMAKRLQEKGIKQEQIDIQKEAWRKLKNLN